jgi:hypothetical protein
MKPDRPLTGDEQRDIELMEHDLASTVGEAYRELAVRYARTQREFSQGPDFIARVADEVQQELMDTFVDTTWPACPRQRTHPLWFKDGAWCCERDDVRIPLGQLATTAEPE